MANQSTITTTIQNTGSVSVPQSGQSFVEANGTSPGIFTTLGTASAPINTTPTAITIPPNTSQVILNATGATVVSGSPAFLCIGGVGVALANMFKMPLGAIATSIIGTTLTAKLPVAASSPVLLLATDVGSLSGINVMFE